jgi:hypothetical protein
LAHLSEKLRAFTSKVIPVKENEKERVQQERVAQFAAWLVECERVAELWEGKFDSAADLRRIRNEE